MRGTPNVLYDQYSREEGKNSPTKLNEEDMSESRMVFGRGRAENKSRRSKRRLYLQRGRVISHPNDKKSGKEGDIQSYRQNCKGQPRESEGETARRD